MSDAVVKIATIVDTDSVKTGTAENVQAIQSGNQKIAVSFQEVQSISTAAFRKISSESKTMAQSLSADSLKTGEATKELRLAQDDLRNALKLRNSEVLSAVQVDALIAASQERVRIATLGVAEAQGEVAVASHAAVTEVQATSAAVRAFEGNPGIRAMEVFIGKTLGLGPLMKNLFPLVGALAFGKILFDIGDKIVDVETKAREAGKVTLAALEDQHEKYQIVNDDLQLTSQRLQDQIDKISGHPNNGMLTALLEAKKMADQLLVSLQEDRKALEGLLREHEISGVGSALSGLVGKQTNSTAVQTDQLLADYDKFKATLRTIGADYDRELASAKTPEAIRAAGEKRVAAIQAAGQKEIEAKNAEAQRLRDEEVKSREPRVIATRNGIIRSSDDGVDNTKKIADLSAYNQAVGKDVSEASLQDKINSQQLTLGGGKQGKEGEAAAKKAAEQQLKAMEQARLQEEQEGKLGAQADQNYWEARIGKFKKGSTEYLSVQEKLERDRKDLASHAETYSAEEAKGAEIAAKNVEGLALANIQLEVASGKITKLSGDQQAAAIHATEYTAKLAALRKELEAINADKQLSPEEKKNKGASVQNQIDDTSGQQATAAVQDKARAAEADKEASDKAAASAARLAAEVAKATEIQAQNASSLELATIAANEQRGGISKLSADHQIAAVRTKEFTDKIAALTVEMGKLKAAGSGLQSGSDAANVNAADQQRVQNQIDQLSGQQKTTSVANNAKIGQDLAKPYLDAFGTINAGWLKVQNDLIAGNRNIKRDFAQMGLSLVETAAKWAEGILAHEVQYIIQSRAAHIAGNQAKVASDATTAAESTGIVQAEGLKQALIDAKSSAVKGWKSGMALPFPENVVAAPALAAVGFAGAIAQFHDGGIVEGGGSWQMGVPILAHAGERVLSYDQTQKFESLVNNGNSGNVHINMGGNNFSQAGSDFKSQWAAHERHIVKRLKTLKREGHLG